MKRKISCLKNLLFVLFLLFLCIKKAPCQKNETGLIIPDKEPFIIELKITGNERIPIFRFGHIILKDLRPDNSKMGYVRLDEKKKPQRITFPKEGEAYIHKILNRAIYPSGNSDTLVLVLNNIWFNETKTEASEAHKMFLGMEKLVSNCFVNADIFRKKNNEFMLVGNFDSVFFKKWEWLPNNCDKLLERSIRCLLKTADTLFSKPIADNRAYSASQFDSLLSNRFEYPILKAAKPAKGIYFTYTDFLTNNPNPVEFEVISDISRNIKYPGMIKEDTVWGYSDGENIFMHIAKGYYRLNRAQNTYEVLGPAVVEYLNSIFQKSLRMFSYNFIPSKGFIDLLPLDISPYFEPDKYRIEYYKFFRLNMQNGLLL